MLKAPEGARPMLVALPIRVQTYDIDFAGHVNNGVYVRWLEDLRMELLRRYYPIQDLVASGTYPVLHSTHIIYKRSIVLTDEPVAHMWCNELGRATLRLEAEFLVDGAVCAHAMQRGILVKIGTTQPVRVPQRLVEAFEAGLPGHGT